MKKQFIILTIILIFTFLLISSILENYLVYKYARQVNFDKASRISKTAIFLPKAINLITFKKISIINLWESSFAQLPIISELQKDSERYLQQTINSEYIDKELPKKIILNLQKINNNLNKIDDKELNEIKTAMQDATKIIEKFLTINQKYIVILQNSDEIRATGGFMGSFFILETKNGLLEPIKIQDIYAPDGQFNGFIEAPKGLNEYLSSGKGMRLVDANWWPNFPDSAKQIISFFKNIEQQNYQGVIAVNLNIIEELLELTGEIYLPDYDKTVNKNNFAQIAREDRAEFFPGSQEKINFLNHFLKIFKIELSKKIQSQPEKFIAMLPSIIQSKNVQFYSQDQELAEIFARRQADGQMINKNNQLYYYLVESNVGINKANRFIDRQVAININQNQEKIIINFQNNSTFPYINYQRIYTNKITELINIKIDNQEIEKEKIDQRNMKIDNGSEWLEIGFLIPILSKHSGKIEITLNSHLQLNEKKQIYIQKQSGLSPTNYTINFDQQSRDFNLISDQLVSIN